MHPILFQLGSFTLYSYGVMMALAWLVGTLWIAKRAKATGQDVDTYLMAMIWLMISGVAGARLLYIYYFPEPYLADPSKILFDRGGLVWYGGLIGATLGGLLYARLNKISILQFADIITPPTALGLAIGRIGCFLSGCCYGGVCNLPWAVQYPLGHESHPHWVHPAQLYETVLMGLAAWGLAWVGRKHPATGTITALFFIIAGLVRFVLEYLRGDGIYWVANLFTASQTISLAGILAGLILLFAVRSNKKTPEKTPTLTH